MGEGPAALREKVAEELGELASAVRVAVRGVPVVARVPAGALEWLPAVPAERPVAVRQAWLGLAEAAALSSQSGKVRLMIIWNVDFKAYGSDPQAGYAIIRADGSCPACNALAAAR